jgi:heparinase II/III-like protein
MTKRCIIAVLSVMVSIAFVPSAQAYPQNLLSARLGARVFTQAKLARNGNPNAILSDGPISKGRFRFAPVDQQQVFTVDFGQLREFDRVQLGTGRNVPQVIISIANKQQGSYKKIFSTNDLAYFQILCLPRTQARYVRFDFGAGANGAAIHSVRIYKRYEHPRLSEVTRLLHERIKPNLTGLEKFYQAAQKKDWPAACSELRAYYAQTHKPQAKPNPNYDLSRAETLAAGNLNFAGLARIDPVPVDWSYMKTTDWYEHKNFLNRGSPLGVPVDACYHTGLVRWVDHFRAIFCDWIDENPKPTVMSGADYPTWRTLDTAARVSWILSRFDKVTAVKKIEDELWANYLYSIWEHADYLKNDNVSGGNWLATITSAVMSVAQELPEFKDRKVWLAYGKNAFEKNVLRDIYPDGKEMEDAPGYICMAYKGMFQTMMVLEEEGIGIDPTVKDRLNKVLNFIGAVTQPNGNMPAIGDWGGGPPYGIDRAIEYYQRDDIRYILAKGKKGNPPNFTSVHFPHGGWSIMRSSYGEQPFENARHLVFKSSRGSHGHHDVLHFTAYAYGRELLIDPAIRSYEHADVQRYLQTSYHNTICMDGKNQPRKPGKTLQWISNSGLDYIVGTFDGYPNVVHQRCILFVKPDYWIVLDLLQGKGNHTCDQNWHFAPDANISGDPGKKTVRTNYEPGGNLLIVPDQPDSLRAESFDFFVATQRYTTSGGNTPAKGWKFSQTGTLPHQFTTVLYPYPNSKTPAVSAVNHSTKVNGSDDILALEIRLPNESDYIFISPNGSQKISLSTIPLNLDGQIVIIRTRAGKPYKITGHQVRFVKWNNEVLYQSEEYSVDVDVNIGDESN